jgi:hypothetical protein
VSDGGKGEAQDNGGEEVEGEVKGANVLEEEKGLRVFVVVGFEMCCGWGRRGESR